MSMHVDARGTNTAIAVPQVLPTSILRQNLSRASSLLCRLGWLVSELQASADLHHPGAGATMYVCTQWVLGSSASLHTCVVCTLLTELSPESPLYTF